MLTLDVLQAKYGDCMLLHAGRKAPVRVLIDGGPKATFRQSLEPRLRTLSREVFGGNACNIDLAVISHIDMDHIGGFLKLLEHEKSALLGEQASLVDVRELWHNSFFDILDQSSAEPAQEEQAVAAASLAFENLANALRQLTADSRSDSGMVAAGFKEGNAVSRLARALKISVNSDFQNGLATVGQQVPVGPDLTMTVLGPRDRELVALREKWRKYIKSLEAKQESVREAAVDLDTSIANLSSIVLMAEFKGRKMLFTGDARGDYILDALKETKWMVDGRCHVDVLKWPHHGSIKNLPKGFFEKITARHHVISANGRHSNPDSESIDLFLSEYSNDHETTLQFTYHQDDLKSVKSKEHFGQLAAVLGSVSEQKPQLTFDFLRRSAKWKSIEI